MLRKFSLLFIFFCFLFQGLVSLLPLATNKEYMINIGDQLLITVGDQEKQIATPVIVRPDGMITYDLIGDIKAEGLTIPQLSALISQKLSEIGYYERPKVTVQLREPRRENIYVIGDVMEPGQKTFSRPITVSEAISSAGGYKSSADLKSVRIIKKGKNISPLDLEWIKVDTSQIITPEKDPILEDGDVLIIPSTIKEEQIAIIGCVKKPGLYAVQKDITVIEALALAEGIDEKIADSKRITVISKGDLYNVDLTEFYYEFDHGKFERLRIKPGDFLIVPEKRVISILGTVNNQGRFAIEDKISLIEALSLSGIKPDSNLKKLRIVRQTGEQDNINAIDLMKNPAKYAKINLFPGDTLIVPYKSTLINWNSIYTFVVIFATIYAMFRK